MGIARRESQEKSAGGNRMSEFAEGIREREAGNRKREAREGIA